MHSLIRHILVLSTFTLVASQKWARAFTAECASDKKLIFGDLRLSPCWEMNDKVSNSKCVSNNSCTWDRIESYNCRLYWDTSKSTLFKCLDKHPLDSLLDTNANKLSFNETFKVCEGNANLEKFLSTQSSAGAKRKGQYKRASLEERMYWGEIPVQVRARHWTNVRSLANALGDVRACRRLHCNENTCDDILIVLAIPDQWRKYSGNILAMRISDDALPIAFSGAHGNRDKDVGLQSIKVFARSSAFLAIISPYFSTSTGAKDFCQRKRPITDNAHSLESTYIHSFAGFVDAFKDLSFIEPHRSASGTTIRIGRSAIGKDSTNNSFIRAFVTAAEEHIVPVLSAKAKSRGFSATIHKTALSKIGSKKFKSTSGSSYFSRTDVLGKIAQGVKSICHGVAYSSADTSRFLHIEVSLLLYLYFLIKYFVATRGI